MLCPAGPKTTTEIALPAAGTQPRAAVVKATGGKRLCRTAVAPLTGACVNTMAVQHMCCMMLMVHALPSWPKLKTTSENLLPVAERQLHATSCHSTVLRASKKPQASRMPQVSKKQPLQQEQESSDASSSEDESEEDPSSDS